MVSGPIGPVLEHVRQLLMARTTEGLNDGQLLRQFIAHRDETAFAALLQRHGPMVLGVCRRVLGPGHDVEDVFQATFLVLIRKAPSIAKQDMLGSWLYGVAYRLAVRTRSNTTKRRARERRAAEPAAEPSAPAGALRREERQLLDEELHGLPEKYRAPLVLFYLEGKSRDEMARQLGWKEGTVAGRLARARRLLQKRLARRGVAMAAALAAAGLAEGKATAFPVALGQATLRSAGQVASGQTLAGAPGAALHLADRFLRSLALARLRWGMLAALLLVLVVAGAHLIVRPADKKLPSSPSLESPRATIPLHPEPAAQKHLDVLGDALPEGAVARLGSTRGRHTRWPTAMAFSADGRLVATRAEDEAVRVWEAATGKEVHAFTRNPRVRWSGYWCFAFTPNGRSLVTGSGNGWLRYWDLGTGQETQRVATGQVGVRALAFSADRRLLVTGGEDNRICLRHPSSGQLIRRLEATPDDRLMLEDMVFSPDNQTLAVIRRSPPDQGLGQVVEFWNVGTGKRFVRGQGGFTLPVLAFAPDGKTFAWKAYEGVVSVRQTKTGREMRRLAGNDWGTRGLAFVADGQTLAVASQKAVELWDVASGQRVRAMTDSAAMSCLALSHDGHTLAAADRDGNLGLWNVATGKTLLPARLGHRGDVTDVACSPDGKTMATAGADGTIRLWERSSGREIRRWAIPAKATRFYKGPTSLAFHPDGRTLASGGGDQVMRLWEVATGKEIRHWTDPQAPAEGRHAVAFAPDGRLLASRDAGGNVCLWTPGGQLVRRLRAGNPRPANPQAFAYFEAGSLAFSPDGKLLACAPAATIQVWEVATGRELPRLQGQPPYALVIAFSPDSKTMASANTEDLVRLWSVATGKEIGQVTGPTLESGRLDTAAGRRDRYPEKTRLGWQVGDQFTALRFSADGRTLFGSRFDGVVYVWDVGGRRLLRRVYGHKDHVLALALSEDGRLLASASADTTVLVWDTRWLRDG
jgi:RNA polymerase sigma factor (sigma-70 family)